MGSSERPRIWTAEDSDKCECVLDVMPDDVLLGRGSGPNDHVGNIKFRDLVAERKSEYLSTNHRQTKALIAKEIVDQVYGRGGRFLKKLSGTESAEILPELLAKTKGDKAENDGENSGPVDVYQIQKHAIVMEKAKQALRQNQRNGSPERPESKGDTAARRNSGGRSNNLSSESPRNGSMMNGGSNGMNFNGMGGMGFNDNSPRFQGGNNLRDTFEMQNNNNFSGERNSQQDYAQQLFQQQQHLLELQQQHDLLQLQFQQRQQQHKQQQREMETHNKLLQEQLQLQIRQEQLRVLQARSLQNIASFRNQAQPQQEPEHTPSSQSNPPAVLDGYATYTTTLDAMEDSRHNPSEPSDDKSLQMSTMMGSFKDMSVKDGEDQSMSQSIGTIEGVGIPSGLSTAHMSAISMMSMMNDSTDSLFKNPQKAGNDVGAKNASWGNNSSAGPLADVIESHNPAAVAAAAVLGRPVPGFTKAERRWSGGFVPTEVQQQTTQRRMNRRGSLQYTPNTGSSNQNAAQELNQMQTMASAMLAMAQREQEQNFNYINTPNNFNNGNNSNANYSNQEMMNQGYHMDGMNGGYRN